MSYVRPLTVLGAKFIKCKNNRCHAPYLRPKLCWQAGELRKGLHCKAANGTAAGQTEDTVIFFEISGYKYGKQMG